MRKNLTEIVFILDRRVVSRVVSRVMRKLVCRHRRIQSAGGRDVLAEHLQMFHAHVLFTAPLSSGHVPQPGTDQH